MLNKLKNFDALRMSVEELLELSAYARGVKAEYEYSNMEVPEWIETQIKTLKREINTRNAEALEARKRELEVRLEGLKTTREKREELEKELAKLNKLTTA
jgi:ATP-dependent Lon protease